MDAGLRARLANQLARGDLVLFSGAGFSTMAKSPTGGTVPSVRELRSLLWTIAFPGEPLDDESTLADIFEVALKVGRNKTRDLLISQFQVDVGSVPEVYRVWFSSPWYRTYSLNVDDLDTAVGRKFQLPRQVRSISALRDALPPTTNDLLSIHLNGRALDFPDVTFSQRQYGERTARPDPWYHHLVADITSHPVIFVGTQLDEPPLWQQLELRRKRGAGGRELRPGSYLVTPSLSPARRAILQEYNIDWIKMGHEEFAETVLVPMADESARGLLTLSNRSALGASSSESLQRVSDLRGEKGSGDPAEFLLGRQPEWADISDGFAIMRTFEEGLAAGIAEREARAVLISGTGGAGKSTTLMRLGLTWQAEGKDVAWLSQDTALAIWELKRLVRNNTPAVLLVDDIESFGDAAGPLLADLVAQNDKLVVVATIRTTQIDRLQVIEQLGKIPVEQFSIPHLEDSDIHGLLDALDSANRLGQLKGMTPHDRFMVFKERANRQLLVAMIEATSGKKFDEKIDRECSDLGTEYGLLYATVAVATTLGESLAREEILLATGSADNETMNRIQRLLNQHMLIARGARIALRHRVIAERAFEYYRSQGQLGDPIRGLAFAFATKTHSEHSRYAREKAFLMRLLNHDWLTKVLPRADIRRVYEEVEELLAWDFHYWLQRGSFEVEFGDLGLAENFLGQAQSLAEGDYMVETEVAYLRLKQAAMDAPSSTSRQQAEAAFEMLERAIAARGRQDSYAYHVMGAQGLSWVRRENLSRDQRIQVLERLRSVVQEGIANHPRARDLAQLGDDLKKEYMLQAVASP